ncbi:FUSC family protein [Methylobacterium aerolatum]|uniref:Membrane protein YccC n=1 Tax=Methylobacterium aerolatum TaxID=418708 RepID=A0ABU0HYF6_9HYPH|nr:FUSC family protein [Methylobacterium aerolatum]MDQ0447345.1 putative membrane protein YccC [Methylobacterium aerolatum]GJD37009.1 p-hydroxybenzoic acid efflux pump subunit AaeB [Methylobacterium aerolatum]
MADSASPAAASSRLDRLVDRIDGWVPKPHAWAFALRIWLAMVLALGVSFWLQLDSASSAATCVAILAQPKRGQALSKAFYRLLGTLVGAAVSIVFVALFGQDRVLLLTAFTVWLGLCVFVAQYLQDTRAYGAMLSGYTVAIIALAQIDMPQDAFTAATGRVAAIVVGIVAITFINDALASPSTWRSLLPTMTSAWDATRGYALDTLRDGDLGPTRTAALIRTIAPMRADANAIAGELDDGPFRAAGARSCIAALYAMAAAIRTVAAAAAHLEAPSPAVTEALATCRRIAAAPDDTALDADDERLRRLVDEAMRDPSRPLDEIVVLQRALDFACAATFAHDGLRALADGHAPLRDTTLPTHRDFPLALRGALRVAIGFAVTAAAFIALGLPQASFALVQVAATAALSSTTPDPKKFSTGVLIGMTIAATLAGIVRFTALNGVQGFPMLAIALAPVIFAGCLLSLNQKTFTIGFILIVFFPVLLSPSNPQSYDAETFLLNGFLVIVAAVMLCLVVRIVLPVSPAMKRVFALDSARRALASALVGEGGDATTRTSLNADRLFQFAGYSSGSGAVRRANLTHAFALARLEAAAARAHAELRMLWRLAAMREAVPAARDALARGDDKAMEAAARGILAAAAGSGETRGTRLLAARAVSDLVSTARTIAHHRPFLRRLQVAPF